MSPIISGSGGRTWPGIHLKLAFKFGLNFQVTFLWIAYQDKILFNSQVLNPILRININYLGHRDGIIGMLDWLFHFHFQLQTILNTVLPETEIASSNQCNTGCGTSSKSTHVHIHDFMLCWPDISITIPSCWTFRRRIQMRNGESISKSPTDTTRPFLSAAAHMTDRMPNNLNVKIYHGHSSDK